MSPDTKMKKKNENEVPHRHELISFLTGMYRIRPQIADRLTDGQTNKLQVK